MTDDTQLTWLLARCIDADGLDEQAWLRALHQWTRWSIGAGRGTLRVIRGRPNPAGQGNGAAMRVGPLVIARMPPESSAFERSCAVTHPNPEALAGAELVARVTRHMLDLDSKSPEAPGAADVQRNARGRCGLGLERGALLSSAFPVRYTRDAQLWHRVPRHPESAPLGGPGWVPSTTAQALRLLLTHGDDWRTALRELYAAGGDTDTVGAILMSWIGAWRGATFFPADLLTGVQGVPSLIAEADRLHAEAHPCSRHPNS